MSVVEEGLWLPTAVVVCASCYVRGPVPRSGDNELKQILAKREAIAELAYREMPNPIDVEQSNWHDLTSCMWCDTKIAVREDVAKLNNLRHTLNFGLERFRQVSMSLSQTGGMCCALEIELGRPALHCINVNGHGEKNFDIGLYSRPHTEVDFDWDERLDSIETDDIVEATRAVLAICERLNLPRSGLT